MTQAADQFKILADLDQAIVQQERLRQGQDLVAAMLMQAKSDFTAARGATDEIIGQLVDAGMAKGAIRDMITARLSQLQSLGLIGEPLVPFAGGPVAHSGSVADAANEPKPRRRRTKEEMAAARAAEQKQVEAEEIRDAAAAEESSSNTEVSVEMDSVKTEAAKSVEVTDQAQPEAAEDEVTVDIKGAADEESLGDEAWNAAVASLQGEPEPADDLGADLDAFDLPEDAGDLGDVNWDDLEQELAADEPAENGLPVQPIAANGIPSIYKRAG